MSYQAWSVVFGEQPSASKWNILGQNDASFNDGTGLADDAVIARIIADGAVLPNHLKASASTNNTHVWDSWTPVLTNFSLGNGTIDANYMRIGNTILFRIKWIIGSTSNLSSNGVFSAPVEAHADYVFTNGTPPVGVSRYDCSVNVNGYCRLETATTIRPVWMSSATAEAGVTSSSPGTWSAGDTMFLTGMYECIA